MSEQAPAKQAPAGLPAWVMTFADLMSLLMCFFVLLLSFSQMDLSKFKKVAGSMENAFGVQREIVAYDIPKGTSVIAQEFSPGKPEPTPLSEIRQKTIEDFRQTLEFDEQRTKGITKDKDSMEKTPNDAEGKKKDESQLSNEELTAKHIAEALAQEIMEGNIEVEAFGQRVIIRIMEQGSFESGLAALKPDFIPVIKKLNNILKGLPGDITIGGHTDNIPIYNSQFKSNWALSAQRAVEVAHAILEEGEIPKKRMSVAGFAETRPLFDNDTAVNRKRNRRVEITLVQGDRPDYKKIDKVDLQNYDGKPLKRVKTDYGQEKPLPQLVPRDFNMDNIKLDYDQYRKQQGGFDTWQDIINNETVQQE